MYSNIMITIDLNEPASYRKAFPTAIALCRQFGAKLHILNVLPDLGYGVVQTYFPDGFQDKARADATEALEKVARENVPEDITPELHLASGTIYKEIIETAERLGHRPHRHGVAPARPQRLSAWSQCGAGRPPLRLLGDGGPGLTYSIDLM